MIEITLEFEGDGAIDRVADALINLTEPLRPVFFSQGERLSSKSNVIDDTERFAAFRAKSPSGFFLLGKGVSYSFLFRKRLILNGFIDVPPEKAEYLLTQMSGLKPVFGYACMQNERLARNRVTKKLGVNTLESWVGRDIEKWVPGFYWLTLLPDALAKQHGVPLAAVEAVALEHKDLPNGQHLFRFYNHPEEWDQTNTVAALCTSLSGVFDVNDVKPLLSDAKDVMELGEKLYRNWP